MRRLVQGLLFLLGTLLVAAAIVWAAGEVRWRSALSDMAEAAPPQGMEVVRDAWGVPTVFGTTDADTAFGLAYALCEDDFPTMEERLAVVRRDLGRLLGRDGAEVDYFAHLTDARGRTRAGIDRLSPEGLAMAQAYADGINAYVADHPGDVRLRRLFPVTATDIVEGFVLISPLFYGLDGTVGDLVEGQGLEMSATFGEPGERGSNAFALNADALTDGSTVLVSNSHQPWRGPVAWYEARVVSGEGMRFSGVTFPGVPTILMGHNEHLGWTNTVNSPDLVDVYRLEMDGNRYRFDGGWRPLERRRVWLRVKFGPIALPVPQTMERSVHGPVVRNDAGVFAFRFAGEGETRHLDQYYRITRARTFEEWREVMAMQAIPGTNFIYADNAGNIALLYNASFPERDPGVDWSGVLPGERAELVWDRYEPSGRIPLLLNPPSGFVFNANNAPFDATHPNDDLRPEDFADFVGIETKDTNRAVRAQELLTGAAPLSVEALLELREDTTVDAGTDYGRAIRAALDQGSDEVRAVAADWNGSFAGDTRADALALMVAHHVWTATYFPVEAPDAAEVMAKVEAHMREHFGRLDPPMGEVLRLREGSVDLPLSGGPGVLRALHSELDEDGRLRGWNGDGYIMVVQWDAPGAEPRARSVMVHGSHPRDPAHPHHADQAPLFARGEFKPAPLPRWADRPESLQ